MLRDIITALVRVLNQCRAYAGRGIKILGDEYVQAILGVSPPDSTADALKSAAAVRFIPEPKRNKDRVLQRG